MGEGADALESLYRSGMEAPSPLAVLDPWLAPEIRVDLEERLWRPIGDQATLETLLDDPAFLADPGHHPAMFADHGIVHARDVAVGVTRLVDVLDGLLLPGRSAERRAFVTALGVATAYLHDVGMVDMTRSGRRVHAIRGAQAAFGPEVDGLVGHLLDDGPIRERLDAVASTSPFAVPLELVLRELLSLSVIHGKSLVPATVLDHRHQLRRLLQRLAFADLDALRAGERLPAAGDRAPVRFEANTDRYADTADSLRVACGPGRAPGRARGRCDRRDARRCGQPTCSASEAPCSGHPAGSRSAWTPTRRTRCAPCGPQAATRPT